MPYNNYLGQRSSFMKEKHVVESEASCEDRVVLRSQSGRKIEETNLSLRKRCSVDGPLKKIKRRRIRKLRRQNLKVPQYPEKMVNLVKILQHENFLQMLEQFFKGTANKQPRRKRQKKKSGAIEKSGFKAAVPSPIDFDSNTL